MKPRLERDRNSETMTPKRKQVKKQLNEDKNSSLLTIFNITQDQEYEDL